VIRRFFLKRSFGGQKAGSKAKNETFFGQFRGQFEMLLRFDPNTKTTSHWGAQK